MTTTNVPESDEVAAKAGGFASVGTVPASSVGGAGWGEVRVAGTVDGTCAGGADLAGASGTGVDAADG